MFGSNWVLVRGRFMISGLYSAATSMDAAVQRHEMAAENLANIQMPGFRRRVMSQSTFDTVMSPLDPQRSGASSSRLLGTASSPVRFDFSQGALEETKRPLDVAITGDGFFTVEGSEGPLYTRNGSFHVAPDGTLTTIDNLPVLSGGRPIVLPDGATTENIEIARDGRMYSNDQEFAQLDVVQFTDPDVLTAAGATLFAAPPETLPQPSAAELQQGRLERANTSSIDEMINIIAGMRNYEASQKALNTIAESVQRRIGLR